jgi:spermidine/putrescine-binding protein
MKRIWSTDEIVATALGRRGFLKGAASITGGALLAPLLHGRPAQAAVGGEIQLMAWTGFDLTDELADWRKEHGVTVQVNALGSQDDVTAKFNVPNPVPFDLAVFNQGYAELYIDVLKMPKPLDPARIPNYNPTNMFPQFYMQPTWYRHGKLWGAPWSWGLNALIYNPAMMPKPTTYKDLLKPELKGKLVIADDTLATWPMAARLAGFKAEFPNLTHDQLKATFDNLKLYRAQSRTISPTYGDVTSLLVSGEIAACFIGDMGIPSETAKQGVKTEYVFPAEGATTWCDAWFIPPAADNIDTAYAYINEALSPEVQAKVATRNASGVVSSQAVKLLPDSMHALFDYSNIDKALEAAPFLGIPPLKSTQYATYSDWVSAWTDFKAG